jgi:hypothetical protein
LLLPFPYESCSKRLHCQCWCNLSQAHRALALQGGNWGGRGSRQCQASWPTQSGIRHLRTSTTDYLNRKRGTDCVLLAYVTGVTVAIPEDAPDYRLPTFDDEMILRAPYTVGNLFQQDNRLVWETLRMAFHGGCRGPGCTTPLVALPYRRHEY